MPYKVAMTGRLAKVPLFGNVAKAVTVNPSATQGAQIDVDLLMPDGTLATTAKLQKLFGATSDNSSSPNTTDDIDEGQFNLWFTDRRAQDAVGSILGDTDTIALQYAAGTSITAELVNLTATALTDLTYPNVVSLDGAGNAYYPDLTNPNDVSRIVGVTLHAAASGTPVQIVTSRDFTELAWSWSPGRIYCALSGGSLTQTAPATGAIVEVARVVSPTTIRVGIQPATLR